MQAGPHRHRTPGCGHLARALPPVGGALAGGGRGTRQTARRRPERRAGRLARGPRRRSRGDRQRLRPALAPRPPGRTAARRLAPGGPPRDRAGRQRGLCRRRGRVRPGRQERGRRGPGGLVQPRLPRWLRAPGAGSLPGGTSTGKLPHAPTIGVPTPTERKSTVSSASRPSATPTWSGPSPTRAEQSVVLRLAESQRSPAPVAKGRRNLLEGSRPGPVTAACVASARAGMPRERRPGGLSQYLQGDGPGRRQDRASPTWPTRSPGCAPWGPKRSRISIRSWPWPKGP